MFLIFAAILLVINAFFYERIETAYLRRTHPLEYEELVRASAQEYGVCEYLIYAIIKTESGFEPDAESNVGARGLMQLMPETFEWLRDYQLREGESGIVFDAMYQPEHNIRYGTYLIAYHMQNYNNNIKAAAAAYHAGAGEVNEWYDSGFSFDDHDIPIPDTAHYVNKIVKSYEVYLRLYETEEKV
ncbi:MAG: lytic transglycosylase domain-containing protein [Oscillospiraceae bacterium]|nr:lytic transglycosylase domain-containing protein [Oscillospiraceae bacterium]